MGFSYLKTLRLSVKIKGEVEMCNALSPEKNVIWSMLHDRAVYDALSPTLSAHHFNHQRYRRWFEICGQLYQRDIPLSVGAFSDAAARAGETFERTDARILTRMLSVAPPPRVRRNISLLAGAMVSIAQGQRVHIERLIN